MARKKFGARLWAWLLAAIMLVQLGAVSVQASDRTARTASSVIGDTQIETVAPLYDDDEIVTVIVQLDKEPLLAYDEDAYTYDRGLNVTAKGEAILRSIDRQQETVIRSVKQLLPEQEVTVQYQYNLATNGFAMEIPYKDMEAVSQLPGVECVYVAPVFTVDPMMDSAAEMEQALAVWEDLGYHGEGMVIAVLDTGIDTDHPLFADAPDEPRLTAQDVYNLRADLNASKAAYVSEKIPFAYNYTDGNTIVDHEGGNDHGTHVAGICAGNVGVNDLAYGVAPEAQIAVFKVMDKSGNGYTTDILAAVEDAVRLGVDVINMSLGAPAGFTSFGDSVPGYDKTYANVEKAGIFLAVAAGNSYSLSYGNKWGAALTENPDTGMIATPGTMMASTTVASVDNAYDTGYGYKVGDVSYSFVDTAADGEPKFADLEPGEYEYVMIGGVGDEEDYYGVDVNGKIAVISRGDITFTEKSLNAYAAGAIAAIVYNNEPGVISMSVEYRKIPTVSVTQLAGEKLLEASSDGKGSLEFLEGMVQSPSASAYQMSAFSCWGVTADLRLEPDITAVGGSVYSSTDNGTYSTYSGTSMATPNLAGGAALVCQAVNNNEYFYAGLTAYEKNLLVNALMMSTAVPLKDEDGGYYSPRKQGSGLVQLKDAISSAVYLTVDGMNRPKIELGDDPAKDGVYTLTFNVHNVGDSAVTYDLSTAVLTESVFHSDEYDLDFIGEKSYDLTAMTEITYPGGSTVKVNANSVKSVTVELKLSDEAKTYMDANFKNGIFVEGFVFLTPVKGSELTLSLPYMGFYGDWTVPSAIDLGTYTDGVDSLSSQFENCAFAMAYYWNEGVLSSNGYFPYAHNPAWAMQDSENPDGVPYYMDRGAITNRQAVRDGQDQGIFCFAGTYVSLLRNVRALNYSIRNVETGEEYWSTQSLCPSKSYYNPTYGICYPDVTSVVWYGTDSEGNYLPNNTKVELIIEAELDYTAHETNSDQNWVIPITIDNEAPQILGASTYKGNDRNYMRLELTDNQYLAYIQVRDGDELVYEAPVGEFEPGAVTTVDFDVTGRRNLQITLGDYAMNEVTLEQQVPAVEGGVVIYPGNATVEVGQTYEIKFFNSTGKPLTFSSSDESVALVDEQGIVTGVSEGTARVYATAGASTAICDITVTPASHTHDYQKTGEVYCGEHTVTVTYTCECGDSYTENETIPCPGAGLADVSAGAWYHEYVDYVVYNGIMKGVSGNRFAPEDTLTRAMLVTTLYRMAGSPEVTEQSTFTDVPTDQWYAEAVAWAQDNGIAGGVGNDLFDPDAPVTREQAATFLYRYVTEYLKQQPAEGADLSVYKDAVSISDYAREAIAWATAESLFGGFEDGTLRPGNGLERAQMAKLLTVLDQKP